MNVTFHAAARLELAEAIAFYDGQSAGLGSALGDDVRRAVVRITEHPESGFSVRPEIRRYVLRRFPYSILYHTSDENLKLLAIMHHRRQPEYWADRL